ncbi:MAG: dockerin type I repeat-containing protein [Oscillospiraceae bacterium]|nr:dockerin type I repeat-containing protein [Oscillospiraceae bacterium]
MKTTRKLIVGLTALLCFSGMSLPVSAKYYDEFRELKSCSDEENVIFAEEDGIKHVYMTYPHLKHQFEGCVVQTDGTVITEDLLGDAFASAESWNTWKEQKTYSEIFHYIIGDIPEIENAENTYILHPVWGTDGVSALNAYAQEHDFVQNTMILYTNTYEQSSSMGGFYIIAPDDVTLTLSDFPELEELGAYRLRVSEPDEEGADTDGEALWRVTVDVPSTEDGHRLPDTEDYYYFKNLEKQLNEAHPEYDFIANFYYNTGADGSFAGYELEPLPEVPPAEVLTGDIDQDSNINILDVILLNRAILGKTTLTEAQNQAADVNHDGTADSSDSLLIMKYIVGLVTEF